MKTPRSVPCRYRSEFGRLRFNKEPIWPSDARTSYPDFYLHDFFEGRAAGLPESGFDVRIA